MRKPATAAIEIRCMEFGESVFIVIAPNRQSYSFSTPPSGVTHPSKQPFEPSNS